jgi:molybdopterin-guanine dinucleotide biosynthesis protein A
MNAAPEHHLVGVALAGGRSRRLGVDKASLRLQRDGRTQTLLAYTVRRLASVSSEVVVAAGADLLSERRDLLEAELPTLLPVVLPTFVADAPPPAFGPAAGLLAAAAARPQAFLLVLACDLPRVPVALLERLVRESREHPETEWIVPVRAGRLEPLCALYSPVALRALAGRATSGRCALHELRSEELRRLELAVEAMHELAGEVDPLLNLNEPRDLERFSSLEGRAPVS